MVVGEPVAALTLAAEVSDWVATATGLGTTALAVGPITTLVAVTVTGLTVCVIGLEVLVAKVVSPL